MEQLVSPEGQTGAAQMFKKRKDSVSPGNIVNVVLQGCVHLLYCLSPKCAEATVLFEPPAITTSCMEATVMQISPTRECTVAKVLAWTHSAQGAPHPATAALQKATARRTVHTACTAEPARTARATAHSVPDRATCTALGQRASDR